MQELLPVFLECDSINYLRYASFYLETIQKLPQDYTEIYKEFIKGKFAVKTKKGSFNAVSLDMKLDQTMQCSKKSTSGIIGQSRQTSYVTEWELVYYETLAISNIFTSIASHGLGFRETDLHHELSGSLTKVLSDSVDKVFNFLLERNNPYDVKGTTKLHHFTTGHIVFDEHAKRLLSFFDHGQANYFEFCKEGYINKTKILSDRITKNQLPLFQSNRKDAIKAVPNKEKLLLKTQGMIQKELDIARSRYISMKDILNFNLSETSILFDGDFTSKPHKHVLVSELEKYITEPCEYLE